MGEAEFERSGSGAFRAAETGYGFDRLREFPKIVKQHKSN
jgi:hypothetical protein